MPSDSPDQPVTPPASEEPDITGIVLAGGASRRMGRDKAMLRLPDDPRGETLLERAARHLAEAGARRIVVATGSAGRLGPLRWPEAGDGPYEGRGPLAGMVAALGALDRADGADGIALVLAVDLPFASAALLRWLAHELAVTGVPGLIPLDAQEGRPQPLHAAFRPSAVLPSLVASLEAGELRVLRALAAAGVVQLAAPDHGRVWHRNVNTPIDLRTQGIDPTPGGLGPA